MRDTIRFGEYNYYFYHLRKANSFLEFQRRYMKLDIDELQIMIGMSNRPMANGL